MSAWHFLLFCIQVDLLLPQFLYLQMQTYSQDLWKSILFMFILGLLFHDSHLCPDKNEGKPFIAQLSINHLVSFSAVLSLHLRKVNILSCLQKFCQGISTPSPFTQHSCLTSNLSCHLFTYLPFFPSQDQSQISLIVSFSQAK